MKMPPVPFKQCLSFYEMKIEALLRENWKIYKIIEVRMDIFEKIPFLNQSLSLELFTTRS